jgi:hypothetical protein
MCIDTYMFMYIYTYDYTYPYMYIYIGIEALPGVLETLTSLSSRKNMGTDIMCGLVTGNVEGMVFLYRY